MFGKFGWPEIAIILVIILVVFGVGKLPQVGGAIGKSIREFRKAQRGEDSKEEEESSKLKSKTTRKISKDSTKLN